MIDAVRTEEVVVAHYLTHLGMFCGCVVVADSGRTVMTHPLRTQARDGDVVETGERDLRVGEVVGRMNSYVENSFVNVSQCAEELHHVVRVHVLQDDLALDVENGEANTE